MLSIKLKKTIRYGCVSAVIPALGLSMGIFPGFVIGITGAIAIAAGSLSGYFLSGKDNSASGLAASVAAAGFVAGILWHSGLIEGVSIHAASYLAALVLCSAGAAYKGLIMSSECFLVKTVLGLSVGFFSLSLIMGVAREIIFLSNGQSMFLMGLIFIMFDFFFYNLSEGEK